MSMKYWRKEVKSLTPYVPGKPIEDVKQELGLDEVIRLASNENPFGPSPNAIKAMKEAVEDSWLYPEPTCRSLREKLAVRYDLSADNFVVANGADHILSLITHAYINKGDEVIYCNPTFSSYRETVLLMGGVPVEVGTTNDYVIDLDVVLDTITDKTKLIYICNPNNPTGTIVDAKKLKSFFDKLPENVLVILDEAYIEYVNQENYKTGPDYIKEGYPVIAIRTFSKYYGLAGARIGYAFSNKKLIEPLVAVRQIFAVNRIAIAGAEAALVDEEHAEMVLQKTNEGKQYLTESFEEMKFDVIKSHSNFIFINMKTDTSEIFDKLMRKGVLIRPCGPWNLPTYARVTIGTKEQNEFLIKALKEVFAE